MKTVMKCIFGSRMYGTSTPESDTDYKSVFIPSGRDILLQRAKGAISTQRPKGDGEKNNADDVDEERFSLQRYLQLVGEGQTNALDMLFAPPWAIVGEPSPLWHEIVVNKDKLTTRRAAAFVGYARAQASRYSARGTRIATARAARDLLHAALSSTEKVSTLDPDIRELMAKHEHMSLIEDVTPHGQKVLMWSVCDRKMHYTMSIKNAHDVMKKVVDEYGRRALMAETQKGADWKALSHAVRVGEEALELLQTGRITFPLPNAAHILDIKQGRLPYEAVTEEIEELLVKVVMAAEASTLPDKPDYEWIDDFVAAAYREEVVRNE